jgi:biopolymer transport protein ExbB
VWSIIQAAGWPIWPLIFFSIAALAICIERVIALRRAQVLPEGLSEEVINACLKGLPPPGTIAAMTGPSVLGGVLAYALRALHEHPGMSADGWRVTFEEAGRLAQTRMQRYLGALGTIASAAPLLGLMGTVIGMIEIFASQSAGDGGLGDPAQLAQGISVALYNTAFGLMIAVPSLIAWRILRARVDDYTLSLELQAERFWRHATPYVCRGTRSGSGAPVSRAGP